MQRILYVTSSLFGDQSASKQLSDEFLRKLKTRHPNGMVSVLGLMGITDVETVYAEGLNMDNETRAASLEAARLNIQNLLTEIPPEVSHAAA